MPRQKKGRRKSSSGDGASPDSDGLGEASRLDFQRGAIVRIKLYNFQTYTSCEFRPGPRLNLVIGPNGSGKSSIVNALALGMGAGPKLLSRASKIGSFVRNGQDNGFIEIELHDDSGIIQP